MTLPRSVSTSAVTRQPNDLRSRLDGIRAKGGRIRIEPNALPSQKEILIIVRQTLAETGTSQKKFAKNAGCTESELSEAVNERENRRFDAEWLWKQDDAFLLKFLENVMDARQLTPERVNDVRRARIVELIDLLLREVA